MDCYSLTQFVGFNLVGNTEIFRRVLSTIEHVATCELPVLIQGETGTGKENAARAVHYLSKRAKAAFVPVNCGSLTDELIESELYGHKKGAFTDAKSDLPGLVEIADGGTLFLDEVDTLSPKAQSSLLRFLQNHEYRSVGGRTIRKVDVRVVSASNTDFSVAIRERRFREDLFYRLNVLNVFMPPLRERADDIPLIANSILKKFSSQLNGSEKTISPDSIRYLKSQYWRGNVRELENTLLRQAIYSDKNELEFESDDDTEPEVNIRSDMTFRDAKAKMVQNFEKDYLKKLLRKTEGNVSEAARISGKERREVGKMLKKYNLDRAQFATSEDPKEESKRSLQV